MKLAAIPMCRKNNLCLVQSSSIFCSFFKKNNFINIFLTVLGLHCCVGFSLIVANVQTSPCRGFCCCGAQALGIQASVVVTCWLNNCSSWALEHRLSSCGSWAQLPSGMWDLPGPGIEPMSPPLACVFLTTELPGKPLLSFLNLWVPTSLPDLRL